MLITTIQELRLASPAHALDSLDGLTGFIDNSEHDFLKDKLGTPLYDALCAWYAENPTHTSVIDTNTGYYNRLLLLAQRVIAFDALGRAIGMQLVSVHNSGVNIPTADDYDKPKKEDIDTYRNTCLQESHSALNRLLTTLESWTQEVGAAASTAASGSSAGDSASSSDSSDSSDSSSSSSSSDSSSSSSSSSSSDSSSSSSSSDSSDSSSSSASSDSSSSSSSSSSTSSEQEEIVTLWRSSRYFYLAASLLIPSAVVLQRYLNFYESREKFIQLLPDLQFIQEEIIAPAIGEDLTAALVAYSLDATTPADSSEGTPALFDAVLHKLRRVISALLVGRTSVLKYSKEEKTRHHDDGVRMFRALCDYIRTRQSAFPASILTTSPLYTPAAAPAAAPAPATTPAESSAGSPSLSLPPASAPSGFPAGSSPSAPGGSSAGSSPSSSDSPACWTSPLF